MLKDAPKTPSMKYGTGNEKFGIGKLQSILTVTIMKFGFVTSPCAPFLGCRTDWYVLSTQEIVEVKCSVFGKDTILLEMQSKCKVHYL